MTADEVIFIFYSGMLQQRLTQNHDSSRWSGILLAACCQVTTRKLDGTVVTNSGNIQPSDMTYANGNRTAYISATDGDEFQWMKWNKANDKYYLC